jgi:hypothetical protein
MKAVRILLRLLSLLTRRRRSPAQPRFPHFDVPPDAPIILAAQVQRVLDEQGIC